MFDLFRSRDKAVRILLGGILVIVAASMITYLIPGSNLGGSTTDDTWLINVDGDKLTQAEFEKHFATATQQMSGLTPQMIPVIFREYLDQEVGKMGALYVARKLGITVTDDELLGVLMNGSTIPPQFVQNGVLVDKDGFAQFLANQGYTIQDFTDQIRKKQHS